ncbi:LysR family transcriptional regulator [Epibacterium sp. Ofav1-8]|uniref:LysR family transcriptional regulator n=1 Tax=Epibacterium sp. Ofav1-8 TaxID=2917735 RepID=UPI001EF51BB4|nr:LysR family transcriptional regulator [Epibacterium sp. Ofav1-8]MCG7625891.1 LysR family transcriptional regulator [Epibacterium sp. Ofav1-8]
MNLRAVDLNLLVILDVLLDEAHVSRAAKRLNLSQPAVSAALQRCRHLLDDELLDRGRGAMHRTPRADALRGPLKSLLAGVQDLIEPDEVPLSELRRVIRITAADLPTATLAGPLLETLGKTAPHITVVFQPWHGADAAAAALRNGDTDMAISVFDQNDKDIDRLVLLEETYVVAMRIDHPAAEKFDIDAWLAWPHIVVSGRGEMRTPLDTQLSALGRQRRVGLVVPSFQLVPDLLERTFLLSLIPKQSLNCYPNNALLMREPPIPVTGFPLHLAWHSRQSSDKGLRHLITEIAALFSTSNALNRKLVRPETRIFNNLRDIEHFLPPN